MMEASRSSEILLTLDRAVPRRNPEDQDRNINSEKFTFIGNMQPQY
jgi:hypothetical protein